ncbi:MAG: hypothetical protein ACE5DN_04950, partial [Flavobacteriales bacterium]
MSYISTFGIYFPHFRIADNILHPKGRKNKHVIGYVDEDIITMAVAACRNLYSRDADLHDVDAILFATNTPIFKERYHASYLAELLGLEQGILAMDMGTTNRAGTDALLLADALVRSGKHSKILLVASEMRFPPIGQESRIPFGHGALALVVSKEEGIAEIG